jgi:hypothetical protein
MSYLQASAEHLRPTRLTAILHRPWVDRTIALAASLPFVVELYHRWIGGHLSSSPDRKTLSREQKETP